MEKKPTNLSIPNWAILLYLVCLIIHFSGCVTIPYPWDIVAVGPLCLFSVFMVCVVVWIMMGKD